jgi:capsular polysaccharide biosynthesis protein
MLAKIWKKVLMLILIVACLFNVVAKLVNNLSIEDELLSSAQYIQDQKDAEKAENVIK